MRHLQELEYKREQKKELIKKRWRKSLIIAKFNLEHKRIRQQQLTLKLTGDKSLRFEERILQKQQEESPMTGYSIKTATLMLATVVEDGLCW